MNPKRKSREISTNLLVTGGCGFIGSNFIRYLMGNADFSGRIINVDKLTYAGNPQNLEDIARDFPEKYIFQKVDICDENGLADVFEIGRAHV
jgi:dTDP-glucose 4,6-dehydratase